MFSSDCLSRWLVSNLWNKKTSPMVRRTMFLLEMTILWETMGKPFLHNVCNEIT
jgi:hypothetical protein